MKVEDLELFTVIVRLKGFTAAANALDLPKSNVSRRISHLEDELSCKLFFRSTRNISLTQYGKTFYAEVVKALALLDRAVQSTNDLSGTLQGKIKIGLLPETGESISHILFKFLEQYPDIELDIRIIDNGFVDTYRLDLDLAFHAGDIVVSNLIAKKLTSLNGCIVASPDYIEKFGKPNVSDDLTEHNCICFRWPNGQVDDCWQIGNEDVLVKGNITSNSIGLIKRSILNANGIGLLPRLLINDELNRGDLEVLLPAFDSPFQSEKVWLLYQETKGISLATKTLIDYLAKEVPKIS